METTSSFMSRVCKKKLLEELERLEKERSSNLRLLQASRNLFQKKYNKFTRPLSRRGSEAASIQMFETHSPGFCYHRNGDCRNSSRLQHKQATSLTDAQAMLQMLLTNGEVDIEKVVCLHLLAAHLPVGPHVNAQILRRTHSSGSQWTSSKAGVSGLQPARRLPAYVLNLAPHSSAASSSTQCRKPSSIKEDLEDVKGTVTLLLNVQLERLVDSAVDVLQKVNPAKVDSMMEMVRDPPALRRMLGKKKIRIFLDLLQSAAILTNQESFASVAARLHHKPRAPRQPDRPKSVTVLTITDGNASLHSLVTLIRNKIFRDSDAFEDQPLSLGLPCSLSKLSLVSSLGPYSIHRMRYPSSGRTELEARIEEDSTDGSSTFSLRTVSTDEDNAKPHAASTADQRPEGHTSYPLPKRIVRTKTVPGFSRSGAPLVPPGVGGKEALESGSRDYTREGGNFPGRSNQLMQMQKNEVTSAVAKWVEASYDTDSASSDMNYADGPLRRRSSPIKLAYYESSQSLSQQPAALTREAVASFRLEIASAEACRRLQRFLKTSVS